MMPGLSRLVVYHSQNWGDPVLHLRVRAPAERSGLAVSAGNEWSAGRLTAFWPEAVDQADRVLIQREFPRYGEAYAAVLARARAAGKPVIYELDDNLLALPRDHPDWRYHARARPAILRAAAEADAVLVSTEPLAAVLRPLNARVHVWPNCWDEAVWPLRAPAPAPAQPVVIGYVGSHTHGADVAGLGPALAELLARRPGQVRVRFVGGTPPPAEVRGRPEVAWERLVLPDYAAYARRMQSEQLDVAVAPLRDDGFNRCKSAIKYLEYAALGAAGVFSRLPPYTAVVRPGENGLLAGTAEEWLAALTALVDDPGLRGRLALAAQADLKARWALGERAAAWRGLLAEAAPQAGPRPLAAVAAQAQSWAAEVEADLDDQLGEARAILPARLASLLQRLRRRSRRQP